MIKDLIRSFISREFWILLTFRFGQFIQFNCFKYFKSSLLLVYYVLERMTSSGVGVSIPRTIQDAKGLRLPHPYQIIITPQAKLGKDCVIFQGVSIGVNHFNRSGYPVIGDDVIIYPGAKIIGNVKIGQRAIIGANAVVVHNVPKNKIVGGVPAKIIGERKSDPIWEDKFFKFK